MRNRALVFLLTAGLGLTGAACNGSGSATNTTAATTQPPTTPAPTTTTKPARTLPGGLTIPPGVNVPPDVTIPPGATLPPNTKLPPIDRSKLPKIPTGAFPDLQFPEGKYPSQPDPNNPGVKVQKGPDATVFSLANDVTFDTNSDVVKPQAQESLKKVAEQLKGQYAANPVEVRGHADKSGDPEENKKLSERRANSVKKYLESQGIAADRIKTIGFGDTVPVDTNDTPEGRSHNRRVEVLAVTKK